MGEMRSDPLEDLGLPQVGIRQMLYSVPHVVPAPGLGSDSGSFPGLQSALHLLYI